MKLLLAALVLGAISVQAYRRGEFTDPEDLEFACSKVYPNHGGISPQQGSPFSLSVSDVAGGKLVEITGSKEFQGFILQANGDPSGEFVDPSIAVINVGCTQGATIRHKRASFTKKFSVTWKGTGPVTFKGAAVEKYVTFYQLFA